MTAAENSSQNTTASSPNSSRPVADPGLEALREILLKRDRQQIAQNEAALKALEQRINDKDALVATITPVLGDAIRIKIRDSREEMVEALYPIIGKLVVRAVSEAIRDLARTVDARVQNSFSPKAIWRRVRAWFGGVSRADMALRESLPFEVAEVFLIHRDSGLLLQHVSRDPGVLEDSEIIGGMLTAIRDFTAQAFGRDQQGSLDEIQYSDRRILIEAAEHAYLAVVVDGVEPAGFRAEMREQIMQVEREHADVLRYYSGDPLQLSSAATSLQSLLIRAQNQSYA